MNAPHGPQHSLIIEAIPALHVARTPRSGRLYERGARLSKPLGSSGLSFEGGLRGIRATKAMNSSPQTDPVHGI